MEEAQEFLASIEKNLQNAMAEQSGSGRMQTENHW